MQCFIQQVDDNILHDTHWRKRVFKEKKSLKKATFIVRLIHNFFRKKMQFLPAAPKLLLAENQYLPNAKAISLTFALPIAKSSRCTFVLFAGSENCFGFRTK